MFDYNQQSSNIKDNTMKSLIKLNNKKINIILNIYNLNLSYKLSLNEKRIYN